LVDLEERVVGTDGKGRKLVMREERKVRSDETRREGKEGNAFFRPI